MLWLAGLEFKFLTVAVQKKIYEQHSSVDFSADKVAGMTVTVAF